MTTQQQHKVTDVDDQPLTTGDKIQDWTALDQKFHRAVITEIDEDGVITAQRLEAGKDKVTIEDPEQVRKHQPTVYLTVLGNSWGVSRDEAVSKLNAIENFRADNCEDDTVTIWTGEVARDHFEVTSHGGVRSTVIENEEEFEVSPEDLQGFKELREEARETLLEVLIEG